MYMTFVGVPIIDGIDQELKKQYWIEQERIFEEKYAPLEYSECTDTNYGTVCTIPDDEYREVFGTINGKGMIIYGYNGTNIQGNIYQNIG